MDRTTYRSTGKNIQYEHSIPVGDEPEEVTLMDRIVQLEGLFRNGKTIKFIYFSLLG